MQRLLNPALSLVVPVYRNESGIPDLLAALEWISDELQGDFEAVIVVDGSPDQCFSILREQLPTRRFRSQLALLSRNFGAFSAIRAGIEIAKGKVITVMAADLQEPPELTLQFLSRLSGGESDVVFGVRTQRNDGWLTKITSNLFWAAYRRYIMPEIPPGGVDIFGITAAFRDDLVKMSESNSSLVAQLFWLGGRRAFVEYERKKRQHGRSAWTFSKKIRYLSDSVFAFTDLPVKVLIRFGFLALAVASIMATVVIFAKVTGFVSVPGYAGTIVAIVFFGALNSLGLGIVGTYAWRAFENSKARPLFLVQTQNEYGGTSK